MENGDVNDFSLPKRPAGVSVAVRVSPAGKEWLAGAAKVRNETESDTLRAMFSFAARFMPTHWRTSDDPLDDPDTEPDRSLSFDEQATRGPSGLPGMRANARGERP